jgi:hypothetical protein
MIPIVLRKLQAVGWFRTLVMAGLLPSLAASGGCETGAGTGAAAGGLLGAGIGGLVSRCPGGALVGAALGAGAGTAVGAGVDIARDKRAQRNAQAAAAEVAARAPSLDDIVRMTQNAVPTAEIVNQIRTCGAVYRLTADDMIMLNRQGVDQAVVRALQDTALRPPPVRTVYTAAPVVVEQPVYVAPPPVVGVGFGWGGCGWR